MPKLSAFFKFGILSLVMFFIASCNETDTKSGAAREVVAVGNTDGCSIKLYNLILPKDSLALFLASGATRKLLLQFVDSNNNTTVKALGLIGYGAKPNNDTTTRAIGFITDGTAPWDTTGVKIFGNLELSRGQIRRLLGLAMSTESINVADLTDLKFIPSKDEYNHIRYKVMPVMNKDTAVQATTEEYTNPSPPAPPCTTCDN